LLRRCHWSLVAVPVSEGNNKLGLYVFVNSRDAGHSSGIGTRGVDLRVEKLLMLLDQQRIVEHQLLDPLPKAIMERFLEIFICLCHVDERALFLVLQLRCFTSLAYEWIGCNQQSAVTAITASPHLVCRLAKYTFDSTVGRGRGRDGKRERGRDPRIVV
jgi:hypothetical protein